MASNPNTTTTTTRGGSNASTLPSAAKTTTKQGGGGGAAPKASKVSASFLLMYYPVLCSRPHELYKFFTADSTFSHVGSLPAADQDEEEEEEAKPLVATGQEEIRACIAALDLAGAKVDIQNVDVQPSHGGGVLIVVYGSMTRPAGAGGPGDEGTGAATPPPPSCAFVQTFFLVPQGTRYYVLNDMFRAIDKPTVTAEPGRVLLSKLQAAQEQGRRQGGQGQAEVKNKQEASVVAEAAAPPVMNGTKDADANGLLKSKKKKAGQPDGSEGTSEEPPAAAVATQTPVPVMDTPVAATADQPHERPKGEDEQRKDAEEGGSSGRGKPSWSSIAANPGSAASTGGSVQAQAAGRKLTGSGPGQHARGAAPSSPSKKSAAAAMSAEDTARFLYVKSTADDGTELGAHQAELTALLEGIAGPGTVVREFKMNKSRYSGLVEFAEAESVAKLMAAYREDREQFKLLDGRIPLVVDIRRAPGQSSSSSISSSSSSSSSSFRKGGRERGERGGGGERGDGSDRASASHHKDRPSGPNGAGRGRRR